MHLFCPKRTMVTSYSIPRLNKCYKTSRIFTRTEQTFASARSFGVISWASFSCKNGPFGLGGARWGIWEVARLGDFITRNQFFYYKCYICWKFKPIFALSYSQILRWPHAGAIISLQVQKKSAWMAWNNVWRFLWSPNVLRCGFFSLFSFYG